MPAWRKPSCWVRSSQNGRWISTSPGATSPNDAPMSAIARCSAKLCRTRASKSGSGASGLVRTPPSVCDQSPFAVDPPLGPDHNRGATALACGLELSGGRRAVVDLERRDLFGSHVRVEISRRHLLPGCAIDVESHAAAGWIARAHDDVRAVAGGLDANSRHRAQHVTELRRLPRLDRIGVEVVPHATLLAIRKADVTQSALALRRDAH